MEEDIRKMLEKEEIPENIKELRTHLCSLHKQSRSEMSKRHDSWDRNMRLYKGIRGKDQEDIDARRNKEPEKFVVPMTYTQVQTFVTFSFLLMKQNQYFYEFQATGGEDDKIRELSERLVQRDLNKNNWDTTLYNSLLDTGRMGITVLKNTWRQDTVKAPMILPGQVQSAAGGPLTSATASTTSTVDVVKYEGNCVHNVDPYKFMPDLRLPLTRWQEGQFAADECEYHISMLRNWESQKLVAGVKYVSKMDKKLYDDSSRSRFPGLEDGWGKNSENDFMVCMTEGQYKLIPKEFDLGNEDYQVTFFIRMANDQRIISIDRSNYIHNEFVYSVGQFSPDNQMQLGMALSDVIFALQDVVTWLINSRIMSVRRSLDNHLVIDSSAVDMSTVNSRGPFIQLKKGVTARGTGIQNFIQQLKVNDTTSRHMEDADTLMRIMQMVTGVNENAMGQYAPGRRSATENRAANAGAASRMKMTAQLLWSGCYGPLGQQMVTNQRQFLSEESFKKVLGADFAPLYPAFHPADVSTLIGMEDFSVFDGTVASEKVYMAQALQDLLQVILTNPETIGPMGYDINKIFDEIQSFRGITNAGRFKLTRPELQQPGIGLPNIGPNNGGAGQASGGAQSVSGQQSIPQLPAGAAY